MLTLRVLHVNRAIARRLLIVVAAALLTACGDDEPTRPVDSLTGSWVGTRSGTTVSMVLSQNAGSVMGNGTFVDGSGSTVTTLFGTLASGAVTLQFNFPNTMPPINPVTFAGALRSSTSITGALNGSGYTNFAFDFRKQ